MDLLKLLVDSGKDERYLDACFLCYRRDNNCFNIYTVFEICTEYYNISLSLADMIKTLFPAEDFLCKVACNDCSDLISKLYILIYKRKIKIKLLDCIMKQLGRQLSELIGVTENSSKVVLKVQMPTYQDEKNGRHAILTKEHDKYDNKVSYDISDKCSETVDYDLHQIKQELVTTGPHCPETFQETNLFNSHLKTHKKKSQRRHTHYHCNNCNYKTLCKPTLQAHINKNHLHTRPHICNVCFKGFYNKSNLTEHVRTHYNQRNEICEVCGSTFIHKKSLIEHLRLHSDTRPYQCDICSKRFITSGRRSDHIKRSHMERSECCLLCNKKYSLKKELTRHVNSVHLGGI